MTTARDNRGSVRDVEEDLAALLDNEVLAAETGHSIDVGEARGYTPSPAPTNRAVLAESVPDVAPLGVPMGDLLGAIDVPPSAPQPQAPPPIVPVPAVPIPVAPPVPPVAVSVPPPQPVTAPAPPEVERVLPVTQRFGAIIMETTPHSTPVEAAPAETAISTLIPAVVEVKTVTPPGPGTEVEPTPLPTPIERTDDQKKIVIDRLDGVLNTGWQKALHQQIDELYRQVAGEFSSPPDKAERSLVMLREARQLLIDSPEEYVTAEFRTMQVRVILDRMRSSRTQSRHLGPRILAYQAVWLLLLLLGLIFAAPLTRLIVGAGQVSEPALLNVYPIINTMIWGGIGGIVGALYTLWWHISREQDFDRNYLMWYLVQPLMGLVLGGIIFLIMAGGFLILQVNLTDQNASTGARLLPYLAAVLAGFRQNFIYEQFDRLIALFTPAERRESGIDNPGL